MQAIWKDIEGYEGIYKISNTGTVSKNGLILSNHLGTNKYLNVSLNNPRKECTVHRLVAKAFIPNPFNKDQVNHKDGVKSNNIVSNLEWCTKSENMQHAVKTGLFKIESGYGNHKSKEVFQYDIDNNFINKYGSVNEASRQTNIQCSDISRAANEKSTRNIKTAGGYKWRYKEL